MKSLDLSSLAIPAVAAIVAFPSPVHAADPFIPGWETLSMGAPLNTDWHEAFSTVTPDELTIYFGSNRPGPYSINTAGMEPGGPWQLASYDIYVAHRAHPNLSWSAPVLLGPNINTAASEHSVSVSPDGLYMYFASDRPSGCGGLDIYVSSRNDPDDDMAWGLPSNLGCAINSPYIDSCPVYHTDATGDATLYFVQSILEQPPIDFFEQLAALDFVASDDELDDHSLFNKPVVLPFSTTFQDSHYDPTHGFIWGQYDTSLGGGDIFLQVEVNGSLVPVNLGPDVNSPYEEQIPSASADGNTLYFASDRPKPGSALPLPDVDLYVSTYQPSW